MTAGRSIPSTSSRFSMVVDKSNQRVQQMFGEIAPRYDFMNHFLSMNVDRYWRWKTVRVLNPRGDDPILDMCTGTGDLALEFCKKTRGKTPVVAADFCHEMLTIGEQKKQRAGWNGELKFIEADAQCLPFPDDYFQICSVAFGLRNVADTDAGLRELARVCKPGGKVAVLEFSTPTTQPFKSFYGWYFRNVLPRLGQLLARNSSAAYDYLPQSVGEFPQGEDLCGMMLSAGLSEARYYPLTMGISTLYIGVK